ncbi:hypothetical protein GGE45_003059 [Rhizobium aethiopicum]|uniref:Uncharacterized protein n=1 Tax=Rhizobium aethiopicum TaxID=1138170 RepID=A0A7W6MIJ1_9HYPH|nr:hypothetical protein [Rhizobium aethiopicum]MBB4580720.1 hypothetical protein [Rhizobium aethiopicum]
MPASPVPSGHRKTRDPSRRGKVEKAKLDDLSKQQISAANGDAFGVFLVGVPIGRVAGGDKEGEIAASKGKVSAMQSAGMSKGCKLPG